MHILLCAPGESGWIHYPGSSFYEIRIPVKNFRANNHFDYKDFLDLIKASEYPYITIQIRTNQFQEFYDYGKSYYPRLKISIAGVTRPVPVECTVIKCSFGERIISGNKNLKLTDFKLDPPIKSLGLIKVKNELNINFEFKIPENLITNLSED